MISEGLGTLLEALEIQPSTAAMCKSMLEEGHVLAVSPGTYKSIYDDTFRLFSRWCS